jgi:diguanylate cyclase
VAEHAELAAAAAASMFKVSRSLQTELARARDEVGAERQKSQTLSTEARTDKLTGLPNRRVFDEELERSLDLWQATRQKPVSLMLIDVDHFKQLNDRYGHPAGDAALQWLARTARAQVGEAGLAARYGGEEFAVVMPGVKTADAINVAERLRAAIEAEPFHFDGLTLRITASVGLATSLADETPNSLIHRSDEALYAAKKNGRNRVYLHNDRECVAAPTVEKPRGSGYNRGDRVLVAR